MKTYLVIAINYNVEGPYIDFMNLNFYITLGEIIKYAKDMAQYAGQVWLIPIQVDDFELIKILTEMDGAIQV